MTSFCAAVNLVFDITLLFDVLPDGVTSVSYTHLRLIYNKKEVIFKVVHQSIWQMCIRDRRIVLRILEACQAELKGVKLKDYAGTKRKIEHGLWDVDAQMHVSDVIFSGRDHNEIIAALDSLA